jgi:sugar/nucleoside kinase (ribokinase family)
MGRSYSAVVVGSLSRDCDVGDHPDRFRAGGTVFYAGCALSRLGARARVVTRLRSDDRASLLAPLLAEGVEALALDSSHTTTYVNDYSQGTDRHDLRATSDPLRAKDVPEGWRDADLIQFGPLHRRDLEPDVLGVFRGFRGIDVQGLVRVRRGGGTRVEPNPALGDFVGQVDVVQSSESELPAVLDGESLERFVRRHGVSEMLVTRGARGASILTGKGRTDVSAPEARGTARVGAGDVFLACYLLLRVSGSGPEEAARRAASASAKKIETGQVPKDLRPEALR